MKRIGFITSQEFSQLTPDDQITLKVFNESKITVIPFVWNKLTVADWTHLTGLDLVVIRSPWDYHQHYDDFLKFIQECVRRKIKLENSADILFWNLNKHYLDELHVNGISCIPTVWTKSEKDFSMLMELLMRHEVVILKPVVSAGSIDTFKISKNTLTRQENLIRSVLKNKECLLQPYLNAIETAGEISIIFFNGSYSHSIVKKPKSGDFRVQQEWGGSIERIDPPPQARELAEKCIQFIENKFSKKLLYSRIDLVSWNKQWVIIEAECCEPQLYFAQDLKSIARFVEAIQTRL